ncbi:IS5 family transposase, partial [Kozakia baliensis]|uniref:IS5 family transposase n=1 Tax=Kozakia baliensis TaxID=153496 RepID=UPI000496CF9A
CQALGRSRGGFGSKVCVAANGRGKALSFTRTPGQAHERPSAMALLDALPGAPRYVVCDRGYASNRFREDLWSRGSRPVIPPERNELPVSCPKWAYRHRHLVENLWARLKEWRAVATRYDKTAASFISVICIAAAADHIKT